MFRYETVQIYCPYCNSHLGQFGLNLAEEEEQVEQVHPHRKDPSKSSVGEQKPGAKKNSSGATEPVQSDLPERQRQLVGALWDFNIFLTSFYKQKDGSPGIAISGDEYILRCTNPRCKWKCRIRALPMHKVLYQALVEDLAVLVMRKEDVERLHSRSRPRIFSPPPGPQTWEDTLEFMEEGRQTVAREREMRALLDNLGRLAQASKMFEPDNINQVSEAGMSHNPEIRAETGVKSVSNDQPHAKVVDDKPIIEKPLALAQAINELIQTDTLYNSASYLSWTSRSITHLVDELRRVGFETSLDTVERTLRSLGYSLHAPVKGKDGTSCPDYNAEFTYLNELASSHIRDNQPVLSLDIKRKDLVGGLSLDGAEYDHKGALTEVTPRNFVSPEFGRAIPCGVYDLTNNEGWVPLLFSVNPKTPSNDLTNNEGWVSVEDSTDIATFAIQAVRLWWYQIGTVHFPDATRLHVTFDEGGPTNKRALAYKVELAKLAQETGLEITACHYPPGISRWNEIEYTVSSFVSMSSSGRPIASYRTIVELITPTTSSKGLSIQPQEDRGYHATRAWISEFELIAIPLVRDELYGDWIYTLKPQLAPQPN